MTWEDIIKQINPLFKGYSNPRELTSFYYGRNVGQGIFDDLKDLKNWGFFDHPIPYDEGDLQEIMAREGSISDDFMLIDNFISAFKQAFNLDRVNRGRNGISNTMLNMLLDKNHPYILQIHEELEDFFPPNHFVNIINFIKKKKLEER